MPPLAVTTAKPEAGFATLRRFLPYLWPKGGTELKLRITGAMLFVLASKIVQVFGAAYTLKYAVDRMARGDKAGVVVVVALVIGYAAARFGSTLFDNLRNVVFERVGQTATADLAANVFRHLHNLSLRFHLERRTGAVTKVIERGTKSIDTMLYFILFNIAPTVLELAMVLVLFWRNFGLPMVVTTIVMVVIYITFTRKVTDWRSHLRERMNDLDTGAVAHAVDSLLNFETVKYFNAEVREATRYNKAVTAYAAAATKSENSLAWLNIGQAFITNAMLAAGMAFVAHGWSQGRFSAGDVVFISTLLAQLFRPLDLLGMVYRTIRQGIIDMEAMFRLIDTPQEIVDAPGAPALVTEGGTVRFEHVDFAYDPERKILHDMDFTVPAGRTLAVVGSSGAGKSTLARLLFRFYDVTGGRITIDGQDIRAVTQESVRRAIGIVPQDTVLFNDTIGYNIAYGRDGATQADVEAAAKGAAIHDFILSLPDGYKTRVGERGLKLSGGEKQRVAIARTLLKDPTVLILDEATSALDSRTEGEIQETLQRVAQRRTTIIIAHRLSTIVGADQILVMEGGRIIERGTHGQLLGRAGTYADMWARQQAEEEEAQEAAE
ncbi:ATP-binding cassette subfamily B protein [Sphingomonas vulcanisoli]|uniref:ATP-binding cassette subfamily B protein n=1 Tax=Sphingomonas vulcanisoli TaxID=1658060 RepID=A0ABX0TU94_9SPHN|nr:ABC transporter ATP-binding protein/permease [Sphingomonas vulcanisoli]NIJ09098.1 ATP-binding cassette subfamily B protein [Sphingomonas vulcanisoli]